MGAGRQWLWAACARSLPILPSPSPAPPCTAPPQFSVTKSNSNGVAFNGIHWGDNVAVQYHIGDAMLAAEGYRLIAELLGGAKPI